MINIFKKKKHVEAKCIVLYNLRLNRSAVFELMNCIINYFEKNCNTGFSFLGYYNESYDFIYGENLKIRNKLLNELPGKIVNLTFDDLDRRKGEQRNLSVEFEISRPNMIILTLPQDFYSIDISNFIQEINSLFAVIYGYVYFTELNRWSSAYAYGDINHFKKSNVPLITQASLDEWMAKCEMIKEGYLKDVYTENFLNEKQLNFKVNGLSLKHLITENKMGTVSKMSNDLSAWYLSEAELKKAREFLYKSSIVLR